MEERRKTRSFSLLVGEDLYQRVKKLAAETDIPFARLIRMLINLGLAELEEGKRVVALDIATMRGRE